MRYLSITFIMLMSFSFVAVSGDDDEIEMKNAKWISDKILVGGQPSETDLAKLKKQGIKTIVTLRPEAEFDRSDLLLKSNSLGMTYLSLPIGSRSDISLDKARMLDKILAASEKDKVAVHCASSNRVGALMALRAFHLKGKSKEDALKEGEKAGLKSLKGVVEPLLK
ncbi:sulfur transferase domain-containing protein [Temperatibacter marinus]|uniref:Sulfur transferase domain-containing protein n=1 Tax=Temperatibacter marinus TaxID=1456591 RepID=A0AA52EGF8_9PROT|nr:sulfur transferase domain-containing protein [Temperatibacter marinus]WND02673.1 sulfur transferase domain-containing protein [Temperatibacter marinus]